MPVRTSSSGRAGLFHAEGAGLPLRPCGANGSGGQCLTMAFRYDHPTFSRDDVPGQLRALHQDGYVLIPGALTESQVRWARAAIDALVPVHWDYSSLVDDHYKCVFNRDPGWLDYLTIPGIIDTMEAALGDDCHIIGQTAWRSHPGFVGAELHADYLVMELPETLLEDPAFTLPMQIVTVHFYLNDIDAGCCPTCVIPGSHRAGRKPRPHETRWRGRSALPVLCRAGDALAFRSELWHSGSRNMSHRSRYLLQVHYGRRMVAQKFSPYLEWRFDPAVIAACTQRQRRLLGDHAPAEYD